MPYALCPMPYAHEYLIFLRKAISTVMPGKMISLIYQFIGEEPFDRDFDNVQYNKEPEFDKKQKTQGLHQVRGLANFKPRKTRGLPDLFELFDGLSFWV